MNKENNLYSFEINTENKGYNDNYHDCNNSNYR
jgi:hypothetical protein